jgi:hypothetical protein
LHEEYKLTITEITEWISAAKEVIIGLSAVFATIFAYIGLNTWRKELKGKAEYQLAKDVLKSVYKVREAFKHVRHPAIFAYEYPEEMRDYSGHLKREKDYEGTLYVYEKRWQKMDEAFRELEEHHLDAQVEWGSEFQNVIIKLRSCRAELLVTIQKMLDEKKNPQRVMRDKESMEKAFSTLYDNGGNTEFDKFTPQIEAAVKEFEVWLRPHIKK